MQTQREPVNVPKVIRIVRDDICINNPRPRTIHDVRLRDALVTYAKSTR
jgi:hypothetical protein